MSQKIRVWVQTKQDGDQDGPFEPAPNQPTLFTAVPRIGEHFALSSDSDQYRVVRVVHVPFANADSDVEISAVKDNPH
jgi:hypothetical protein